ncbi:Uncharacterized protein QTN25_007621 [Entamoeba marina]
MRYSFQQSARQLSSLLQQIDTQSSLPIGSNISGIVSYFIQSLSKKSQVESLKDKDARLQWLRNFFVGVLQSIISLVDTTKYDGIICLWQSIINLFQTAPPQSDSLLQTISSHLSKLYKRTVSIEGMDNLLINISFDNLRSCNTSIERSSKVQFFFAVSRYGNHRYTNTLALLWPIVEPLLFCDEELIISTNKEYCNGLYYIAKNHENMKKNIRNMKVFERLDIDGVLQFMKEMIKKDTDKRMLCLPNFYLLFHSAAWIGACSNVKVTVASSMDLLVEYFPYVFQYNQKDYDWMLVIMIETILEVFTQVNYIPSNNSSIKILSYVVDYRVDLLLLVQKELIDSFMTKLYNEFTHIKDKREHLILFSSLICGGKTPQEVSFLKSILTPFNVNFNTIQNYFTSSNSRQHQGVILSLTKLLIHLIKLPPHTNTHLIPYMKQFLSIEPTQPPAVKQVFIHCLSTIPLSTFYDDLKILQPNSSISFAMSILRLYHIFISDINLNVRLTALKHTNTILLSTIQYIYKLQAIPALVQYTTQSLMSTGILAVSQIIAISKMVKIQSIPLQSTLDTTTCIPRTPNELFHFEEKIARNILTLLPTILNSSFEVIPPTFQITGLHGFTRIVKYLFRTQKTYPTTPILQKN